METIHLNFKYTQQEYVKAARQYLFLNKTMNKVVVVFMPVFFVFSIFYYLTYRDLLGILSLVLVVFFTIMEGMLYFYFPVRRFQQTAKIHKQYHLEFTREAIVFKTLSIDSVLKWDAYKEYWESDEFFFLIQAPNNYTLIPKRAIAPALNEAFLNILTAALTCTRKTG